MWQCQRCNETVATELSACWNCGAASDGEPDPTFRTADVFEQEASDRRKRRTTVAQRKTWIALWAAGTVLLLVLVKSGSVASLASFFALLFDLAYYGLIVALVLFVVWVTMGVFDRPDGDDEASS